MTRIKTFARRECAEQERDTMQGWHTHIAQLYLPDDPQADADGNAWIIECWQGNEEHRYMCTDGYIR